MIKINWKSLLINIAIPLLLIGGLSALLTIGSMDIYSNLKVPALAPPGWLFPIVWTILFILMGIASYIVWESSSNDKLLAFAVYGLQLILNFIWSIVFFNLEQYWLSFVILIALIILIILNIYFFNKISNVAAILLVPYLVWVLFAGYLNLSIAIMN